MIAFIEGTLVEKNPAYVVLDCNGLGYFVHIPLFTYSRIPDSGKLRLHTHLQIREDAHVLYGFHSKEELNVFRHLLSVSGVGATTALMILSAMSPEETRQAVVGSNTSLLQSIKGIGAKTAQRIVIDLKDKFEKEGVVSENFGSSNNTIKEEALSALVMLGFARNMA
jgi:holliday junction DNA helicase RuvA